ncbi:MAG: alpha-E domain-containing protein, partial [Stellaceae bacterium]
MSNPLLARYAECIFWLSRFVERAENLARILEVHETYARDKTGARDWYSIVQLNADEETFAEKHSTASARNVIRFYLNDRENPTSILNTVKSARENGRTLRPLISTEMWVQLNVFYNRLNRIDDGELTPGALSPLLNDIKQACQTFTGITEGTFYRD